MSLNCYRCGSSLAALTLPLSRLDACPSCGVHLHVCRMCCNYAPRLPDACSEDDAPEVRDKQSANFCDYFKPNPDAFSPGEQRADAAARAELAALFDDGEHGAGAPGDDDDDTRTEAEALFKR